MFFNAEDARKIACMNSKEFNCILNGIMFGITQEAEKGNFGMTYSVEIYSDDVLDAVKSHLLRMGYDVSWALARGVGCSARIFNIRWI